jgi:DNA-directed RNA polymerase specialized sigma24 family protein
MTDTPEKTELSIAPAKARRRTTTATTPAPTTAPTPPAPDPREDELQRLQRERDMAMRALIDSLGGLRIFEACTLHYRDSLTVEQVAAWAGLPATTTHRRIVGMYRALAAVGLAPAAWRRQKAGRARKLKRESFQTVE